MFNLRQCGLLLFTFCSLGLNAQEKEFMFSGDPKNFRILSTFDSDDCNLVLLKDCKDQKFIIKSIKSLDSEEQALLIIDTVASKIAEMALKSIGMATLIQKSSRVATLTAKSSK